jgi:hypothetical protein
VVHLSGQQLAQMQSETEVHLVLRVGVVDAIVGGRGVYMCMCMCMCVCVCVYVCAYVYALVMDCSCHTGCLLA